MVELPFCILIVDDENDFLEIARLHFEDRGYRVLAAKDGAEALAIFKEERDDIDLVITDIRMPRMEGDELIGKIHSMRDYLPIIGITGHLDIQETLKLLGQGAYYYLHKPLDPWAMVDRLVENAIHLYRYEREIRTSREKEKAGARLLCSYIMASPVANWGAIEPWRWAHTIGLEPCVRPIPREKPSGDFAEWFHRTGNEVVFYVADASGHDDLLACLMSCLSSMVLHRLHHGVRPKIDEIIFAVHRAIRSLHEARALEPGRHLTFFIGQINLEFGELQYINCGHPDAFLLRQDTRDSDHVRCRRLPAGNKPLGVPFDPEPYVGRERLEPGDVLFLYTDGANELLQKEDRYAAGIDRLEAEVKARIDKTSEEIANEVAAYLESQAGPRGLTDDTTLMVLKIRKVD